MKARFLVLSLVLVSLSACGFEPMYGTTRFQTPTAEQAALETQLEQVEINNIPNRDGQYLRNQLIDRFYRTGRPDQPLYTLNITRLNEVKTDLDITKESDATRAQLRLSTTMTLLDSSGQEVLSRKLSASGSYNILTSEFTTRVSQENTRNNVLNDLAAQIERQIALYLGRQ